MDDKQVAELLTRALTAVDAAKVPGDLREVAFTTALTMLTGGQLATASSGPALSTARVPTAPTGTQSTATGGLGSTGSTVLDAIVSGLDVNADLVRRLFADRNGEPELIIKSSKLPKSKAAAAPDIALLLMAARQSASIDDYTDAETIRAACRRYGQFDQSNFGKHMKSLDNFILTQGKGVSTKRKLTHPGLEAAKALIEKYAAAE